MDEAVSRRPLTFNGPVEAGVRAVAVLGAAFPRSYDIQRLTALDYLLVHTGLLDGPDDLHPSTPIRTPITEVRRKVVGDGLHLMMTRDLVSRVADRNGIRYCAGEAAAMFLGALRTPYHIEMKTRARWLVDRLADYSDAEFRGLMRQFFDDWVVEFQQAEQSLGTEP